MTDQSRAVVLEATVDTTGTRAGFNEIARQAGTMEAAVVRSGQQAQTATNGIGGGAARSASQVEAAQRNLIGSIQRTTAAMEAGSRTGAGYYEVLARQRGVDPAVLAPYLAQLRAIEATQGRANAAVAGAAPAMSEYGMSARATAAALRQVPAQLTDIIVGLQGGQAPLTVLLQQGGQLRDVFGSVGGAARALGGAVIGLVNPYTVVAAAVAGLAIAHHAGAAEAEAYKRTIILTGNAVGATSGQLADISRTIGLVSGSQRVAAEAVTALAGTGRVSVENLQKFGAVAVEVQKVIGRSIAETATDFESLGKTPLTALEQINSKYHFITASTYAQVKALQDQGRATDAAKVAQDAYADAVSTQKDKILASLTDWERGWIRIKNAASGALDTAIDAAMGRQATNAQKITGLFAERELIEKRIAVAASKGDAGKEASFRADLARNETEINGLRTKEDVTKAAAKAEANGIKITEAKNKWLKDGDQYLTRAAQLERDITAARNEGAAANLSSGEIEARIGGIRKKYADIYNDAIDSNIEALKRRAAIEDLLAKRAQSQITFNRAIGSITEQESIKQNAEVELDVIDRRRASLAAELELIKGKQNSLKDQAAKIGEIDALDTARLKRAEDLTRDLLILEEKRAQASRDLVSKGISSAGSELEGLKDSVKAQNEYNEQIGLNKVQISALQATRLDALATLKDESAAAIDAIEPGSQLAAVYRDQAAALRERAQGIQEGGIKEFQFDEWKKSVDTYSTVFRTGFADMLNNGKAGWQSFTKSLVTTFKTTVADQIYKMFAEPFVIKLVASLLGVSAGATATLAQAAGDPAGAASTAGGYVGIAQSAKAAYDAIGSGFASLGNSVADGVQTGLNATGLSSNILTNGPLAQMAGSAASIAAAAAASVAVGRVVSGQYNLISKTATDISSLLIGGFATGLINRAFGMGAEQVKGNTLTGSFGASGFTGGVDTAIHQDGGWFRSDKNFTRTTAADSSTAQALSSAYDQIKTASADFATTLGINAVSIKDRAQSLSIALTEDKAANQKAITDFFVGVGDSIAKELLPTIGDFSKAATEFGGVGESASATLQRIASDYAFIDVALASINSTFGAVGVGSIAAREKLVDLSGGLDAFGKGVAGFAQNYLTEAERLKPVAAQVDAALAALGFVGDTALKTRDDFKAAVLGLVDSGKLATDAGAATYAGLIKVQDGFAQLHPAIEATTDAIKSQRQALQDQLDQLTLSPAQLNAKERAKNDPSNQGLFDQVKIAEANKPYLDQIEQLLKASRSVAEQRALDVAGMDSSTLALYDRVQALKDEASASAMAADAIAKAKEAAVASAKANSDFFQSIGNALADTIKNATDAAKALRSFNDSLLIGSLSPLDAEAKYQAAKKQFDSASPTDTGAATAFLEAAKARDAGDFSYSRDFAAVQAKLGASAIAQDQLASSIPALWRSIQENASGSGLSQGMGQQAAVLPAQNYAQPTVIDTAKLEAEIIAMREQLADAMAKVADSSAKTADLLDRVTSGGTAMENA